MNVLYLFVAILGFMWGLRVPLRPVRRCWYFWRPCWARGRGTRSTWAVGPNCSTETNKQKNITALSRYSSHAIFPLKLYSSVVSTILTGFCNHQHNLILKHSQLPFIWRGGMGGMLLRHTAGRILVTPPEIEPGPLAVTAQSPNHRTTRELSQLPHDVFDHKWDWETEHPVWA